MPAINSLIIDVSFNKNVLHVVLADGREIYASLAWFPRLLHANNKQRKNWRLIAGRVGVHWEEVDEDTSIESLLATAHHPLITPININFYLFIVIPRLIRRCCINQELRTS